MVVILKRIDPKASNHCVHMKPSMEKSKLSYDVPLPIKILKKITCIFSSKALYKQCQNSMILGTFCGKIPWCSSNSWLLQHCGQKMPVRTVACGFAWIKRCSTLEWSIVHTAWWMELKTFTNSFLIGSPNA